MELKEKTTKPEMILRDEKFSNPISEKLSHNLKRYTGKHDRANVAIATGVGTSTVREVVYRANPLTENNSKAIIALIDIAVQNCENAIVDAIAAIEELKESVIERKDG